MDICEIIKFQIAVISQHITTQIETKIWYWYLQARLD